MSDQERPIFLTGRSFVARSMRGLSPVFQSLFDSPPCEQLVFDYLQQIQSWRAEVLHYLTRSPMTSKRRWKGLSQRARSVLTAFLPTPRGERARAIAANSPHNIDPPPSEVLHCTPQRL
jgi:hypothetical protein